MLAVVDDEVEEERHSADPNQNTLRRWIESESLLRLQSSGIFLLRGSFIRALEVPMWGSARWLAGVFAAGLAARASGAEPVEARVCPQDTSAVLEFSENETRTLEGVERNGVWTGTHARAHLTWPRINHTSTVHVFDSLVSEDEASQLIELLSKEDFDVDKDTVDRMTTFEFYLQKNGNIEDVATIPGKPAHAAKRQTVREAAVELTTPILEGRIVPLVNELYPNDCHGQCRPCFSFVRRYDQQHRTTHQAHLDVQALVTVVVSLNSFGADFDGGLYVSTGNSHDDRLFVAMQRGDAVVHQSDLLHGVQVGSGHRWSWILWFYDGGESCNTDPSQWFRSAAEAGDPLAQFLQAKRAHMRASKTTDASVSDVEATERKWLEASAAGGFARAENDLAALLLQDLAKAQASEEDQAKMLRQFGASKKRNAPDEAESAIAISAQNGDIEVSEMQLLRQQARALYEHAAEFEGDAMYNVGLIELQGALEQAKRQPGSAAPHFQKAVALFSEAAAMGSNLAMFNLAVAHQNGRGVAGGPDLAEALHWFQCAETSEGMRRAAAILGMESGSGGSGDVNPLFNATKSRALFERAARLGDLTAQWKMTEIEHAAGDDDAASEWLKMAAEQSNDAQAMYTLGRLVLSKAQHQEGTAKADAFKMAVQYLRQSAAMGWTQAREFLQQHKELTINY